MKERDADLQKIRRHMRILVDIGKYAGGSKNSNAFLDQAVRQVSRAVEIDHVKILRYRRNNADFIVEAGIGWKPGVVRVATLAADLKSAPGRAFQTADPVSIKNFSEQNEYVLSGFLKEHGIVSLANTPIMIDGAAWGVLEVDSTTPRDFSDDTTEFLTAAGNLIGTWVRHHGDNIKPDEALAAIAEARTRDTMLREMQHRVKNNFQIILSSIAIQKRRHKEEQVHRCLDHIASRINAISLAHDQLAVRDQNQVVNVADYLRSLCASIRQQADNIEIEVEADEMSIAIDRAVPLGLILNEAVTNSVKHAFGEKGGKISVRLASGIGYSEGRLVIADDGKGMGESGSGGSGHKLIELLARQIGGILEQKSSKEGTTTTVEFPVIV